MREVIITFMLSCRSLWICVKELKRNYLNSRHASSNNLLTSSFYQLDEEVIVFFISIPNYV